MDPAVMSGAVLVAIGGLAAFAIKRAAKTQRILPITDSPRSLHALAHLAGAHSLAIVPTRTTRNHPKAPAYAAVVVAAADPAAPAADRRQD